MAEGLMIIIHASGAISMQEMHKPPSLREVQLAVGDGYVEMIPHFGKYLDAACEAYGDEEGKLKGKPVNTAATELWKVANNGVEIRDFLVGPIVILTGAARWANVK